MKSWGKRLYRHLVKMNDSPGRIAGGFAVGVLMGVFPTFGLGGVGSIAVAAFLRLNIAAALLGAATGVPPFIFVVWIVSAWIGSAMLGLEFAELHSLARSGQVLKAGFYVALAYGMGNLLLTVILSASAFFAVRALVRRRRVGTRSRSR